MAGITKNKMSEIMLTPEAVSAYKTLMTKPKENGLDIPSLDKCFIDAEEGTAKHILFKEYLDRIQKPLPKVFFYIIMDELYANKIVKCADGNLGYKLKLSAVGG